MKHKKICPRVPGIAIEPYAYFLSCEDQIGSWLRTGYTMKTVFEAYKKADPPFPGSYSIFRKYCLKHDLVLKGPRVPSPEPPSEGLARSGAGQSTRDSSPEPDVEQYRNKFDFGPSWKKRS